MADHHAIEDFNPVQLYELIYHENGVIADDVHFLCTRSVRNVLNESQKNSDVLTLKRKFHGLPTTNCPGKTALA